MYRCILTKRSEKCANKILRMEKWWTNVKKFIRAERAELCHEKWKAVAVLEELWKLSKSRFHMTVKELHYVSLKARTLKTMYQLHLGTLCSPWNGVSAPLAKHLKVNVCRERTSKGLPLTQTRSNRVDNIQGLKWNHLSSMKPVVHVNW